MGIRSYGGHIVIQAYLVPDVSIDDQGADKTIIRNRDSLFPCRGYRQQQRQVFRFASGHDRVDGDIFHRKGPVFKIVPCVGGRHFPDHLIGIVAGPFQHVGDPLFRRQNDRQKIRIPFFQKHLAQIFLSVGESIGPSGLLP